MINEYILIKSKKNNGFFSLALILKIKPVEKKIINKKSPTKSGAFFIDDFFPTGFIIKRNAREKNPFFFFDFIRIYSLIN